jgi:hypothetical protein
VNTKIPVKMASNQIESLKQLVRNWITALLQVLETSDAENSANVVLLLDSMAEVQEAERVLGCQILQILEENGMNTEEFVNAFNRARNQSSSDTEVQESVANLRQQISEIPDNTRILEMYEELKNYYERILNDGFLRDIFQEAVQIVVEGSLSRQSDPRYMAEVKEKLKEFLRKFLEVETALNEQHN